MSFGSSDVRDRERAPRRGYALVVLDCVNRLTRCVERGVYEVLRFGARQRTRLPPSN